MSNGYEQLWEKMIKQFSLGKWSFHGPGHWRNVEANGLRLARLNGADEEIVCLFALFHDAKRQSDGADPEHGHRAAALAESLHESDFTLEPERFEKLLYALRYHNDGLTSEDVTIGTCWDADRMDLPRVGIIPEAKYMSTQHGKQYAWRGEAALQSEEGLEQTDS